MAEQGLNQKNRGTLVKLTGSLLPVLVKYAFWTTLESLRARVGGCEGRGGQVRGGRG